MAANEFLTKSIYHLHYAQTYMAYFEHEADPIAKLDGKRWNQRIKGSMELIKSALTPKGRELLQKEIEKGDPMGHAHIFENMLLMSPEQRALLQMASDHILKNEFRIEKEETTENY